MLAQQQSRTSVFNDDECIKILEKFRWNCWEAVNYVLDHVDSDKLKSSITLQNIIQTNTIIDRPFIPNDDLNELNSICHFEIIFQSRHQNLSRWPTWFKSTLQHTIYQCNGPFAIFLNNDKSTFATKFTRQILCSSSILNLLQKYKCILWPWDVTYSANKQRLIERSGPARQILLECFSCFNDVDNYPLLLLLHYQNNKLLLLDIIHGNWNLNQTQACLKRILNPAVEQSMSSINQTTSLSPGWIGGRTAGNIHRRPSFLTTFRLSRSLQALQRPHYISFYQKVENVKEIIVGTKEANKWLDQKHRTIYTRNSPSIEISAPTQKRLSPSKRTISPSPSLLYSTKREYPIVYMSPRRAAWASIVNR